MISYWTKCVRIYLITDHSASLWRKNPAPAAELKKIIHDFIFFEHPPHTLQGVAACRRPGIPQQQGGNVFLALKCIRLSGLRPKKTQKT